MKDVDIQDDITLDVESPLRSSGPRTVTGSLIVVSTDEQAQLGKRFALEHRMTRVGREEDNHVVLDDESVSRRHACFERRADAWVVVDLGSTNGTFCNGERCSREVELENGDRVKIGKTVFKLLSGVDAEVQYREEIYRMTILDGLTRTYKKRYLLEALGREIFRSKRHKRDLTVLGLDVDHLARINDAHGLLAGDFVLKEIARVVRTQLQPTEVFARCDGDEFAILLPETSRETALAFADRLRQKVSEHRFVFETIPLHVTVSLGAALLLSSDRSAADLLERVVASLHLAKEAGRDRVAFSLDVRPGAEDEARDSEPDLDVQARRTMLSTLPPAPRCLLSPDQLRDVEIAAAGLAGARATLLSSLPRGIASSLPIAPSQIDQLASDLAQLNIIVVAVDGSVPLKRWLAAACQLESAALAVATFERAMKSIDSAELFEGSAKREAKP